MINDNWYVQNSSFPNRYISPEKLFKYLEAEYATHIEVVGTSTLGKPIYKLEIGRGSCRILAWSQMHGNESNATLAMLDLLEIFKTNNSAKGSILSEITLDFIFMLNPDGSAIWERRNALEIDLNRDFNMLSSKEFPILKDIATKLKYDYALNLHEQRTVFSTDLQHPATLSFLAPAEDVNKSISETRKKSMSVIAEMYQVLNPLLPNRIARYDDEFYPNSTGDNFMKMGLPTILFEGGHYEDDYLRKETRKFYTIALYQCLKIIATKRDCIENWKDYFEIPENKESHYDIIYRNVKLNTDFECVLDVALHYKEVIKEGHDEISFLPIVMEVGDIGKKKGWKEIDCTGKFFKSENKFPKLDAEVNFEII